MGKVEKLGHPEFLTHEVKRLITSAKNRLEQQRIHIAELRRDEAERAKAQRELKLMQAALDRLRGLKRQWERG
jgi:SMC interacting uncharacterized protein involved in chromosome segregation